jgi:hypothetical protein
MYHGTYTLSAVSDQPEYFCCCKNGCPQATSAKAGRSSVQKVTAGQGPYDPFQQFSLTPFEFHEDQDDDSSSGSACGGCTGSPSPANSMHSCQDNGLISSEDPAASEFLLFALALHDQGFADLMPLAPASNPCSSKPTSKLPSVNSGLCTLTRHCAGALDAMLPSDCATAELDTQHDAPNAQHDAQQLGRKYKNKVQQESMQQHPDSVQQH